MDLDQAYSVAQIANSALDAFGKVKAFLRNPSDQEQKAVAQSAIDDVEQKLKLAKAQVGKTFGYQLCKCTLPPTVCLSTGFNDRGDETSRCPSCGREYPVYKSTFKQVKLVRG